MISFFRKIFIFLLFFFHSQVFSEAFFPGEKLDYSIYWKGMMIGTASMQIQPEKGEINGVPVLVFKSTAKSESLLEKVHPVDDLMVSSFDPKNKRTISGAKKIHEGRFHKEYHVEFDHQTKTASWWQKQHKGDRKEKPGDESFKAKSGISTDLPNQTMDILSAFYAIRSNPQEPYINSTYYFPVYDDLQVTLLKIEILREETLDTVLNGHTREMSTLVIRPKIETSGFFKSDGEVLIWISNDFRRIPLKIVTKVKNLGDITVLLERTEGLADPEEIQKLEKENKSGNR